MIQIAAALSAGLWLRGILMDCNERRLVGSVLFSASLLIWALR